MRCDECSGCEVGWAHLAAEIAAVAAVAAVAAWVYGHGEMWDMMGEELRVDPRGAQASLSALAGLVAAVPVYFVAESMAGYIRKNRLDMAAARRRLRGMGRDRGSCRWCGCAMHKATRGGAD